MAADGVGDGRVVGAPRGAVGGGVGEPVPYGGHGAQVVATDESAHRAAVGVAAGDDVLDAEDLDGVLDGGGLPAGVARAVRGHDAARRAQLEELAGPGAGDQGGYDPGVGTGDEQDGLGLARSVRGELLRALSESAGVVDEGLHELIPPGAP